jgi:hypothetical protein
MPTYTVASLAGHGAEPLLRWLIPIAHDGQTLSYGRIAKRLAIELGIPVVFPTHIGHVAGHLMDLLLQANGRLPLINALVVDQKDGLPGRGITSYLVRRFGQKYSRYESMSQARKKEVIGRALQTVYAYPDWESLYKRVFRKPFRHPTHRTLGLNEKDGKSPDGRGGESPEHKYLKTYVRDHPKALKIGLINAIGENEWPLKSGDVVDVKFADAKQFVLVEVKSVISNDADLERGIYQCVKYRAVAGAQMDEAGACVQRRIILVTERKLPKELFKLAKRLDITSKVLKVNKRPQVLRPAGDATDPRSGLRRSPDI